MSFLTEAKLSNVVDLPLALPATEIKQGDWLLVATIRVVSPMKLTYRYANLKLIAASVDTGDIQASNKVSGSLGLAYLTVRRNYAGESPDAAGALDTIIINDIGLSERDYTSSVEFTTAGDYSWIVANNMQAADGVTIPASTEINFTVSVSGSVRLSYDSNG